VNDQTLVAKLYIPSLFTTQPGTHLLETILITSAPRIFAAIWQTYFVGKIGRLAGHPTANYVVARAIGRLELEGLEGVVRECKAVAGGKGMISQSMYSRNCRTQLTT
jgi:nucleolar protein 9